MLCTRCGAKPARSRKLCPNCYESQRSRIGWQSSYIDAEPTRQHIFALRAAGIGNKRLRELSGVSHNTIQVIITGRPERGTGPTKQVWRRTAEKILAVPIPEVPHHGVADGSKVAALGTRRRLRALVAAGYSRRYLCGRLGMDLTNGCRLWRDDHEFVLAATARAVEAFFVELQLTPGPSSRARNEGRRRGWPLPLAWDEDSIDDPDSTPDTGAATRTSFADWYSDIRDLGLDDHEAARRRGVSVESLQSMARRHGFEVAS